MKKADTKFDLRACLFESQDLKYRDFQAGLVPNIDKETMIGVRVPVLRKIAKDLHRSGGADAFVSRLPHTYYEENMIHAQIISMNRDFDGTVRAVDTFLPYVDNWAVCDTFSPKVFTTDIPRLKAEIRRWTSSGHPYTVRFGLGMLMKYCLDDRFESEDLDLAASVASDDYYVRMMAAWYFATALAKQYESVVPYLENGRIEEWTHNKTIRKAIESYRISEERKQFLRTLKR